MKYLIASDLHGSYYYSKLITKFFEEKKCDKLILLGDILYHGPRNPLPKQHDPKAEYELLNQYKDKIICVKGNCDADIDQMVLQFPILAPYFLMEAKGKILCFTHGDIFNADNLPFVSDNVILIHGHTHQQHCDFLKNCLYLNPGSISCPKDGHYHGFMIFENDTFKWYDEEGNLKMLLKI